MSDRVGGLVNSCHAVIRFEVRGWFCEGNITISISGLNASVQTVQSYRMSALRGLVNLATRFDARIRLKSDLFLTQDSEFGAKEIRLAPSSEC